MRISFVAGYLDLKGAGSNISLDILARTLTKEGHDVNVFTLNLERNNCIHKSVPYTVTPVTDLLPVGESVQKMVTKLPDLLETNTDIFHVFDPIFAPIFGVYRYFGGNIPVVSRLNSYTMFCTNPSLMSGGCHKNCTALDKFRHDNSSSQKKIAKSPQYLLSTLSTPTMVNSIDRLFAQSPSIRDVYREVGVENDRFSVITNFYDPSFGGRDYVNNVEIEENMFNILYVGRLERIKGLDVLLDAIDYCSSDVIVDIVGDGETRSSLEKQALELSIENQVTFHGWVDHEELPEYYDKSNVFVHPARWIEPSGRALLEALQYRCPAIVSNIGGPPWIVGEAGYTFEPEDSEELSRKIDHLAGDEGAYRSLVAKSEKRVTDFDPEDIISRIENEYVELVDR
ncbi:glycosyltransferase family 4 protein [Halomontanus rarus]|uniref:glycosyltransferase family 4 protein n=1 Tax=Halomontanus rarus TaxID=3034020 RepID=UPI0023E88ECF|nr:glycosyltransferase family 4 protein [Halovivax sp. TS33]